MFTYGFRIQNIGYFEIERHKLVNYLWGNERKVSQLEEDAMCNYNTHFQDGNVCFFINYHGGK